MLAAIDEIWPRFEHYPVLKRLDCHRWILSYESKVLQLGRRLPRSQCQDRKHIWSIEDRHWCLRGWRELLKPVCRRVSSVHQMRGPHILMNDEKYSSGNAAEVVRLKRIRKCCGKLEFVRNIFGLKAHLRKGIRSDCCALALLRQCDIRNDLFWRSRFILGRSVNFA